MFTEKEREKLLIYLASKLSTERRKRGILLNYPEVVSIISSQVIEWAREGRTVTSIMESARNLITQEEVMEGVKEMVSSIQVEATFPDGTKLVTIHNPI